MGKYTSKQIYTSLLMLLWPSFILDKDFCRMLMKRPAKSTILTDLYDGDNYDTNLANILFTFNTDGGTLFT